MKEQWISLKDPDTKCPTEIFQLTAALIYSVDVPLLLPRCLIASLKSGDQASFHNSGGWFAKVASEIAER